jgi:hypothetical protein
MHRLVFFLDKGTLRQEAPPPSLLLYLSSRPCVEHHSVQADACMSFIPSKPKEPPSGNWIAGSHMKITPVLSNSTDEILERDGRVTSDGGGERPGFRVPALCRAEGRAYFRFQDLGGSPRLIFFQGPTWFQEYTRSRVHWGYSRVALSQKDLLTGR